MAWWRVDLHLHTSASFDSQADPEAMLARSRRLGLGPLFVTDHDTIEAGLRLREEHPGEVIVGQEVTTSEGELIGLFLEQPVPSGLSPHATAMAIKDQGGLVYLQHPYDTRRRALPEERIEEIASEIDLVEVFNGRSSRAANRRAVELWQTLGTAAGAGSDAHRPEEVGCVYVRVAPFQGPTEFLERIREGEVVERPSRLRLGVEALLAPRRPRLSAPS